MSRYPFPLCIQLTPPTNLYENPDFAATLAQLQKLGFYGVELNLVDFSNAQRLTEFLGRYGLRLTMVATGFYANRNGLSLSSTDEAVRHRTVEELAKMMRFAAGCGAGVICGFIKGGAGQDKAKATEQMLKSLAEVTALNDEIQVPIYLESTNHYEATLVNTMAEGAAFARQVQNKIFILPDTYHMNIEEESTAYALTRHQSLYHNLHVSDNNRYFPGFGAIDFFSVCALLKGMGYQGTISIEGRVKHSLREDIAASAAYLEEVNRRILRLQGENTAG